MAGSKRPFSKRRLAPFSVCGGLQNTVATVLRASGRLISHCGLCGATCAMASPIRWATSAGSLAWLWCGCSGCIHCVISFLK